MEATLNEIVDPCSAATRVPIGLLDMGIIEFLSIEGNEIQVRLLPTFPGCIFVGLFKAEIERRLGELEWCAGADVQLSDSKAVWDETRIRRGARARLETARMRARESLGQAGRPVRLDV